MFALRLVPSALLVAAPLLLTGGEWFQRLTPVPRPADLFWDAHILLFVAGVLFALVALVLWHQVERGVSDAERALGAALLVLGAIAFSSQIAIDFAAVLVGGEEDGRREILRAVRGNGFMYLVFYRVGPLLIFIGLALQCASLLRARTVPLAGPALAATGALICALARIGRMGGLAAELGEMVMLIGMAVIAVALIQRRAVVGARLD